MKGFMHDTHFISDKYPIKIPENFASCCISFICAFNKNNNNINENIIMIGNLD
jgi:hypothetical protein